MYAFTEGQDLVVLRPHEQKALDAINSKRTPGQLYPFGYYEARKNNIIQQTLYPEEVLVTRWLATCTGFGMKLASQDKTQDQNSFVLAHIAEHPALALLSMFKHFRNNKYTVEEIAISSQTKNIRSIMAAIWSERAQNLIQGFNLNPKIVDIDSRKIEEFSGLILTTEGGIFLKGQPDLGKLEPHTPKSRVVKYYSVKRWSW